MNDVTTLAPAPPPADGQACCPPATAVVDAPSPIIEALRSELLRLVQGDLDANLPQIERVAIRSRELLMALKAPEAQMLHGHRHAPGGGPVTGSASYSSTGGYNVYTGSTGGMVSPVSPVGWAEPEQFGATSIRQLTSLVPDAIAAITRAITHSPQRLVVAIAAARLNGQDALADKLEARLLGDGDDEPPAPAAPAAAPSNGVAHPASPSPPATVMTTTTPTIAE
jgi:hypothetical protein